MVHTTLLPLLPRLRRRHVMAPNSSLTCPSFPRLFMVCDRVPPASDVSSNRRLVKMTLERMGFKCEEACDGIEAVGMAAKTQYRLILMDNIMPRMVSIDEPPVIPTLARELFHDLSQWWLSEWCRGDQEHKAVVRNRLDTARTSFRAHGQRPIRGRERVQGCRL